MEILEQPSYNQLIIKGCDGKQCQINDKIYEHSIIIFEDKIIPWPVNNVDDINSDTLQPIIKLNPDCVIFGTGKQFHFLEAKQLQALINAGIGYESMQSSTACGSYQLIASDGRSVLGAIILE